MKHIILFLSIMGIISCNHKPEVKKEVKEPEPTLTFPRYVYNDCTGAWAVRTNFDVLKYTTYTDTMYSYYGHGGSGHSGNTFETARPATYMNPFNLEKYRIKDSMESAIGSEIRFKDSASAKIAYEKAITRWKFIDSILIIIDKRAAFVQDSIIKCETNYK